MEEAKKQSPKIHRWIFLALIVLSVVATIFYPPVRPHIQLPAEPLTEGPLFGNFYLTNTLVATAIADILLLLVALSVRRQMANKPMVLTGIAGAISAILEALYNLAESTAEKHARKIFPFFATIFLLVWIVNYMELIPGVDSIGFLHHSEEGHPIQQILPGVYTLVAGAEGAEGAASGEGEHAGDLYSLIPFVRVASTDLNFTIALALSSVFMTQVIGLQTLGLGYLKKYWNTDKLSFTFSQPLMGGPLGFLNALIDFAVGILEVVAEFAKVISFSFRLFGNIFAGSVMLFVIGTLVPVIAQSLLLLLEMFVGLIQAFVFGMLTLVFMSQATHGHGEKHEEELHVEPAKA